MNRRRHGESMREQRERWKRGETLHDWIVAEFAALFEPEPDEAGEGGGSC